MRKITSLSLVIAMVAMLAAPVCAEETVTDKPVESKAADSAVKAESANPDEIVLQKGVTIKLELVEGLSSQKNRTGDVVRYKVVNDIKVNDVVIIEAGAEALGKIANAKPAKGWGKGGSLDISVENVKAKNGKLVALAADIGDSKSWNAGKTIIGVAAFGLLVGGGMKGKKVFIDKGSQVDVFIAETVTFSKAALLKPSNATAAGKADDGSKVCFKNCEAKTGDEFKTCMASCNECKSVCEGLEGDKMDVCLVKCTE